MTAIPAGAFVRVTSGPLAGMTGVVAVPLTPDGRTIVILTSTGTPAWLSPDALRRETRVPQSAAAWRARQRLGQAA